MSNSKGNWKKGSQWGTVVTDDGDGFPPNKGHTDTEYYGGYLIAESIAKDADVKLISAAPDLLDACKQMVWALENNDAIELSNGKASAIEAIKKANT